VIAALELAAAVVLLPWRWDEYHRVHGDLAVYVSILLAGHGASAVLLLFAGRRERRTWLLGGYFLFRTTLAPLHMLPAFLGQVPPAEMLEASVWEIPGPTMALLHLCGFPLALAIPPAFLWAFAREYPKSIGGPCWTTWRAAWCRSTWRSAARCARAWRRCT
ncbi:MAG: hypothetical protein OXG44_04975, partial [Gammaproteobacteria bacterium]|nr:hypothetical protein [Gammaproteobacteria bacterium]